MDIMNEFCRYGITLKRLTLDKIELVRNWRNDPKISQYMDFKEHITPDMQLRWFSKINNDENYYYIVNYEGQEIGLVNVKDFDKEKMCGESGIFIYNDSYLNTDVGIRTILCNMDFAFEVLKLEYSYGHVMKSNKRAIRINKAFGNVLDAGQEDKEKQRYILTKQRYFEHREKMLALLR